jgi:predicted ATPase
MTLSALRMRNYRSFAQLQSVELRPLTLFYGHNSAGKSALLRLLPLLSGSVAADATAPLNLASPVARRASFRDLRWKDPEPDAPQNLELELEWRDAGQRTQVGFGLEESRQWQRLIVEQFKLVEGEKTLLEGRWRARQEEQHSTSLTYELTAGEERAESQVQFRGLVPEPPPGNTWQAWELLRRRLLDLRGSVLWLGSRQHPERLLPRPPVPQWTLKPDGTDLGGLLASQPDVLRFVAAWCRQHLQRDVELTEVPPAHFQVTLRHLDRPALDVDLLDSGEGVIKVLPVLAALALTMHPGPEAPRYLCIEEPESHLHPVLQRALAEHVAQEVSSLKPDSRILMETHSQHILLGVQLQVARGKLRPDQVRVYWVEQDKQGQSEALHIPLTPDGRLVGPWPSDVYTEINDMAGELLFARQGSRLA